MIWFDWVGQSAVTILTEISVSNVSYSLSLPVYLPTLYWPNSTSEYAICKNSSFRNRWYCIALTMRETALTKLKDEVWWCHIMCHSHCWSAVNTNVGHVAKAKLTNNYFKCLKMIGWDQFIRNVSQNHAVQLLHVLVLTQKKSCYCCSFSIQFPKPASNSLKSKRVVTFNTHAKTRRWKNGIFFLLVSKNLANFWATIAQNNRKCKDNKLPVHKTPNLSFSWGQ